MGGNGRRSLFSVRARLAASFHFPQIVTNPVYGLDAFAFGVLNQRLSVTHGPTESQWALVGHVADPHQVAFGHGRFGAVDTRNHAIGAVHQKRNRSVIDFDPLQGVKMREEAAQGQEHKPLVVLAWDLNHQRNAIDKDHRPRAVFGHFEKRSVHVKVQFQVGFEALEQGGDVFATNRPPFSNAPFVAHGRERGRLAFILRHRALDVQKRVAQAMTMWCTIRTFAKHARELGNAPAVEPIIFVKPASCLHHHGPLPVTDHPGEVHHEVECVVRLGDELQPEAIAVGLDLTDRAAQGELRVNQLPWAKAKCFRASAVVGDWHSWTEDWDALVDPAQGLHLSLTVNGEVRQSTPLHEMSVTPAQQIAALQSWAPVESGHLLFTGTPEGVGRFLPGDTFVARLTNGKGELLSEIVSRCD